MGISDQGAFVAGEKSGSKSRCFCGKNIFEVVITKIEHVGWGKISEREVFLERLEEEGCGFPCKYW